MTARDEWAANLTAYIDGELSEAEARRLEEALKADPELAALERALRATIDAVEGLPSPEPSLALRRAVLGRLDAPSPFERLKSLFTLPRLVPAAGLAAAAAVAVVVLRPVERPPLDAETLFVAQNIEVLEDMELIGLDHPDDLDVVARLHELEATP